jgi:pilus assembly protein Flp/PilA
MLRWRRAPLDDTGASAVEYGLLVVAIAAIIVLVTVALGSNVFGLFQKTCSAVSSGIQTNAGTC